AEKVGFPLHDDALQVLTRYASNGREAVNMIQIAAGLVLAEGRKAISRADVEWVINCGQYSPRPERKVSGEAQVGCVHGLALYGPSMGTLVEVEARAIPANPDRGTLIVTGMMEEEEVGRPGATMR